MEITRYAYTIKDGKRGERCEFFLTKFNDQFVWQVGLEYYVPPMYKNTNVLFLGKSRRVISRIYLEFFEQDLDEDAQKYDWLII